MRALLPIFLCLLAAPAWAEDPWIRAAAEVRVGDGLAALTTLAGLAAPDADAQAVRRVLTARARLALGEPGAALEALAEAPPEPLAGVHALLVLRARVAAEAAPAEVRAAAEALAAVPALALPLQVEAAYRRAAAEGVGVGPTVARAILEDLADHPDVPAVRARAMERLALADLGLGEGGPWDRRLLIEHGHTAPGRRAADRLDPTTLSEAARAERAQALFKARAYALQLEVERGLFKAKDRAVAQRARLRACVALLRLRDDVPQALAHCEAARRGPDEDATQEALYRRIIALGRLGRWAQAVKAVGAYLRTRPSRFRRTRAGYQVGRLWHQAGRWRKAAEAIAAFVKTLKRDRETWAWFVGWAWYRAGDCARAEAEFAALADDRNLLVGAKALYWTAKCELRRKRPAEARKTLARLADRAPLGYYGALGAALAAQLGADHPLVRPAGAPFSPPEDDLDGLRAPVGLAEDLRAVRLRVRAGYPDLARDAAARLMEAEPALRDPLERLTEQFGVRWARQRNKRLPWDEGLLAQDRAAMVEALPPAYLALARAAGRAEGVSPWWLIAHMLQESRFKARARSHAGALGPMQVLPRTGLRIAARIGFPAGDFFEDELYRPGVALRHAAWYLAALRHEFHGKLTLAIAAYNGGPRRFAEHTAAFVGQDYDLMVEEIGAHESRNYLRKVSDHLIRYAALYADDAEYARLRQAIAEPGDVPVARGEIRF